MKPDSTVRDKQKNKSGRKWLKRFIKAIVCLILIMVLAILAVLLLYAVSLHHKPDLDELLIKAKLAKLPESIQNLKVETRPNMDDDGQPAPNTSEMYIKFEAEPNDINNFINNSPGIDKNSVRQAGPLHDNNHVPAWWSTDDSSGRMYVIHGLKDINGMVAVYDDSNTVRMFMWYVINPQIPKMQDEFVDFLEDVLHEVTDLFN